MQNTAQNPSSANPVWLRGPLFDVMCVGLPWVFYYLWITLGLGLGRAGVGLEALSFSQERNAIALATFVALGLTYVHRHYTFFVVYGDPGTFSQMTQRFIIAPLIMFSAVALARLSSTDRLPGALSPWGLLLVGVGIWNVWHTIQQRYGILRIYAGKLKHGLQTDQAASRDRAALWGMVAITAAVLGGARRQLFIGHDNAKRVRQLLEPLMNSWVGYLIVGTIFFTGFALVLRWLVAEIKTDAPSQHKAPRLWFMGSTAALFAVFLAHGPVVGYLCFGVAHSLEYVAFVHHFGEAKFKPKDTTNGQRSVASVLLGRPWMSFPLLAGGLLGAYLLLQGSRQTDMYVIYYNGTTLLHFLYDGWIWKVRKPVVAQPLGVTS